MKVVIASFLSVVSLGSICQNFTLDTIGYDLSSLKDIPNATQFKFAFCSPITCLTVNGYSYTTYAEKVNGDNCLPLTPNTVPVVAAFTSLPDGVSVQFPVVTLFDQNKTQISTTLTITCSNNNQIIKITNTTDNYHLEVKSVAGCYYSIPNYFWQFLIERKILFALILIIIGLFELFMGYFLIQITIFLLGWLAGSAASLIYLAETYPGAEVSPVSVINYMIILSSILGIFYGFMLITLPKLGYFNIGVWLGAIGALMLQNAVMYLSKSLIAFYIVLGVFCLVLGIIAIMAFKYFIIVSTAIISGFLMVRPLGFFLDYYPNEFLFYKTTNSMPWQYYLYLISMIVLAVISIVFQSWLYRKTGKRRNKLYHLEEQGNFKDRLKRILEFKEIKEAIAQGKQQFNFLKNLVTSRKKQREESDIDVSVLEDYNPQTKKKDESDSDEESVEIELVEMKGRKPVANAPSKQNRSEKSVDSETSKKSAPRIIFKNKNK